MRASSQAERHRCALRRADARGVRGGGGSRRWRSLHAGDPPGHGEGQDGNLMESAPFRRAGVDNGSIDGNFAHERRFSIEDWVL